MLGDMERYMLLNVLYLLCLRVYSGFTRVTLFVNLIARGKTVKTEP